MEEQRILRSERLKHLKRRCPQCEEWIESMGHMVFDSSASLWCVSFWCPTDNEEFQIWAPEYSDLIQDVLGENA